MDRTQWKQIGATLLATILAVALFSFFLRIPSETLRKEMEWLSAVRDHLRQSEEGTEQIQIAETPSEKAQAYLNRGIYRYRTRRFAEAISDFTAGLGFRSEQQIQGELLAMRGSVYACESRYGAAVQDYTAWLAAAPAEIMPYWARGLAYLHAGEYDRAKADISHFGKSIRPYYQRLKTTILADTNWSAWGRERLLPDLNHSEVRTEGLYFFAKALVEAKEGQYGSAILDANQAIARRPASYELYRDLAAFEFRNGDWRQGWADYLMSVRLAWSRHSSSQSATGYWRYYT